MSRKETKQVFSLRLSPSEEMTIARAAKFAKKKQSAFIREAALRFADFVVPENERTPAA